MIRGKEINLRLVLDEDLRDSLRAWRGCIRQRPPFSDGSDSRLPACSVRTGRDVGARLWPNADRGR